MTHPRPKRPSRAMLEAELIAARARLAELDRLVQLEHELAVEREEVALQQEQLVESHRDLEASHERYVELFDFAPVGYVTHDENGVITELNLQASVMLGQERTRMLGIPLVSQVAPADRGRLLAHLSQCRRRPGRSHTELTLRTRAGAWLHVLFSTHVTRLPGAPMRFNSALVDLSERDRAEAERTSSEHERQRVAREQIATIAAAAATDHFLAVLSHELRTPLTPIMLALASLKRRGVPDAFHPTFELIQRNVTLEARLIDDLLDVTRIRQGKLRLDCKVVELHDIVEDVLASARPSVESAGIALEFERRAGRSTVLADPLRLQQVLSNLVQNAMRNTPSGGRITVETENPGSPALVHVLVRDTGRGIAPEMIGRLFKPFEQAEDNRAGLGLGLSISRGLVEVHGGRITASSPGLGRGSTFAIELHTTAPRSGLDSVRLEEAAPTDRRLSILLVEDNEDNALALADLLSLHGFRVECARDLQTALRRSADEFDIVVSDLGLPDGSGFDLIKGLRARHPVKAIALSGYGSPRDVERSIEAGFALHFTKPVDPDVLIRAIRKVAS